MEKKYYYPPKLSDEKILSLIQKQKKGPFKGKDFRYVYGVLVQDRPLDRFSVGSYVDLNTSQAVNAVQEWMAVGRNEVKSDHWSLNL